MSSVRCKVGWHDWHKWGRLVLGYAGLTQFRSCKRCGVIDYRKCYGNQVNKNDANESIGEIEE